MAESALTIDEAWVETLDEASVRASAQALVVSALALVAVSAPALELVLGRAMEAVLATNQGWQSLCSKCLDLLNRVLSTEKDHPTLT
jgi:hypothetical protein